MNRFLRSVVLLALALPVSPAAQSSDASRTQPWPPRVVELAESLPVQDGGRIKPLSTFANFTLLRMNGKRGVTTESGLRLSPTEWLLDTLFFPESASRYPAFLVQNSEVIEAIGLPIEGKKKRDRYSYDELEPGLQRLMSLAHEYSRVEDKDRSAVQAQIVFLAENVIAFVRLNRHETLALVPPVQPSESEWWTSAELLEQASSGAKLDAAHGEILTHLGALADLRGDMPAFTRELEALHQRVVGLATVRGEYAKIGLEQSYYRANLITWSLAGFVLAFLCAAVLWLKPKSRVIYAATSAAALAATLLLVAAIVMRCMIRERPPVSTLYETVIFVTAVGAAVALVIELIDRRRLAVSVAALLGLIGLFVANGYETLDKKDTMPSLVAVLDTNFWLATHVTAITVGYSAGMLAALIASIYLVSKTLRLKRDDPSFYRSLARMTYGVLCFGVIFATVGTILGGIWANESWGRFWGWDPKENGALLIVLAQIAILHGRMCGWLREHGLCTAAALGGTVVAFSWWGVNLLGVGLHSYGFTSGIHTALWTYYGLQWGIAGLGGLAWLRERASARERRPVERPAVETLVHGQETA